MNKNAKKILLAIPQKHSLDALYPPTGLLYLASIALKNGHHVKVIDGQIEGDDVILQEIKEGYDYFGTTILTPLRQYSYSLVKKIKQLSPECVTIAGGAHVSVLPIQTMTFIKEIDIVVIGEGESVFSEIISGKALTDIAGIVYRKNGEIVKNKLHSLLSVENIPIPAWNLISLDKYKSYEEIYIEGIKLGPMLTIYSSRGCMGKCSFCSTWRIWRQWRQLPVKRFVDEIEILYNKGINHYFIADDSMIDNPEFLKKFSDELRCRQMKIYYKIACRADKVTHTTAEYLKKTGCYEVHVGFESGSQKILDAIGKGITVEQNIKAAEILHAHELKVYALMLIGHFEENVCTINETIKFLHKIKPDSIASMFGLMILPGTKDYQRAKKEKIIDDEFWLTDEPYKMHYGNFSTLEARALIHLINSRKHIYCRATILLQTFFHNPKYLISQIIFFIKKIFSKIHTN